VSTPPPGTFCALFLPGCWTWAQCEHHRRRKGQQGSDEPWNLLPVCHHCHNGDGIHQHVDWSNRHGLILRTGDDPSVLVTGCPLDCRTDHRETT
jgi:hypothetical protein